MRINDMIDVLQAFQNGKTIQRRHCEGKWFDVKTTGWNFKFNEYRIKPENEAEYEED